MATPRAEATAPAATAPALPNLSSPSFTAASDSGTGGGTGTVSGRISAPGGPYLFDSRGRVVFFHGVDAVYKYAPYELYPDPGKPWDFSTADASLMARLGFNVVRLGMTWSGLEPGTAPANDPAVCARGKPAGPTQFNRQVLDRYLAHLTSTVDLLGRFHIYTILDMHQDVYNQMFDGEGAPRWAVCTNNVPSVDPPGRWSLEYGTKAAGIAFHHFWDNDVRGDLQGQYDQVWGDVAHAFSGNRWVLGYDPFNEPFSTSLIRVGDEHFDSQLECFYTGTGHIGTPSHNAPPLRCPADDPANGVIPTILANDPRHLIFDEPDNYASRGLPTYIGPMDLPNLVFNVHIYCGARSPVTGNPTNAAACAAQDAHSLGVRAADRPEMASATQAGGPAWFVSEFGASSDPGLLASIAAAMDARQVSWAYWAWKYYGDPDGERGRVARHGQRPLALDCAGPEPGLSRGGRWDPDPFLLLTGDRRVRHGVRAQSSRPRTDARVRADRCALPPRILRAHHGRHRHLGAGERSPPGAERTPGSSGHGGDHSRTVCRGRERSVDRGIGWAHVPQHHHPARARARGHSRRDRGGGPPVRPQDQRRAVHVAGDREGVRAGRLPDHQGDHRPARDAATPQAATADPAPAPPDRRQEGVRHSLRVLDRIYSVRRIYPA